MNACTQQNTIQFYEESKVNMRFFQVFNTGFGDDKRRDRMVSLVLVGFS